MKLVEHTPKAYFFNAWVDFLLLGGGSVIVLLAVAALLPNDSNIYLAAFMLWLAHFINHPHFAHSYQIFYANFSEKLFSPKWPLTVRYAYWFVGVAIPLVLAVFFIGIFFYGDNVVLGLSLNLMAFLVGWHYVKQGYGILMADSVLKKNFFSKREKNIFLANAYVCWLATWVYANRFVEEKHFFTLHYYTFDAPQTLVYAMMFFLSLSSFTVIGLILLRIIKFQGVPFNGVVAYLVSLYVWLICVHLNPLFVFIIPAFHSLQYLVVVWRYKANVAQSKSINHMALSALPFGRFFRSYVVYQMVIFCLSAVIFGYFGFWGIPFFLGDVVPYNELGWDTSIFMVGCWVFINVHHYFIDSVMWRKNNKDIQQHLFSHV